MSYPSLEQCPLCAAEKTNCDIDAADVYTIHCQKCKSFRITREAARALAGRDEYRRNLSLIRGYVREQYEQRDVTAPAITQDAIAIIMNDRSMPRTPMEKLDRLLIHVERHSRYFGSAVRIDVSCDSAVIFASGDDELSNLIDVAIQEGLITRESKRPVFHFLTFSGFQHVERLKSGLGETSQAFVAMWFDATMNRIFDTAIAPALDDHGYSAWRADRVEHDGKVDDLIIAEIRKSRILIADFTGHRGGVYYEAGFAQGLGIPVIRTCRDDDKDNLHFDTRQFNHILWKTPEDLKTGLSNRIAALYPIRRKRAALSALLP